MQLRHFLQFSDFSREEHEYLFARTRWIKDKFKRFSDQGFADARGLLDFVYYKAIDPATGVEGWVAPKGAAWHPIELLRVEEEQRKLVEKVNKDAAKKRGK